MNKKEPQAKSFQSCLKKLLKDPKIKKHYSEYWEQMEITYRSLKMKKRNSKRYSDY
ncbi:MAG: hypothetical protein WCX23_01500 [Candidatus Paceibacterota bacterium]|jgi:hypothetical protein|nr:hypothetical protein [Candidatus Paceibacterota bacterium]MDD4830569.1 hypothetical protein [Candidatus Paceibacterota bacterium]MDD4874944.1 hypothetical protein [Candidatus Paceibacterota bacterium]